MTNDRKVTAWSVTAVVDWPPGSARKWDQGGKLAQPQGPVTLALTTVAVELPTEGPAVQEVASKLAHAHYREAGHRYAFIRHIIRNEPAEGKARDLVAEALERASYDSRAKAARERGRNGNEG